MNRLLLLSLVFLGGCYQFDTAASPRSVAAPLLPPDSRNSVERSKQTFEELARVFQHPRCANCHPGGDSPLQVDGRLHLPVVSGFDKPGAPATDCGLCHQSSYNPQTQIPGAPHWSLAPDSMRWAGRSAREICAQLKDPHRNGGKSLDEVHEHIAVDELVAYGWQPGPRLDPAPGSAETFASLFRIWIDSGAHCP